MTILDAPIARLDEKCGEDRHPVDDAIVIDALEALIS